MNIPNVVFSICLLYIEHRTILDLRLTNSLLTFRSFKSLLKYSHAYRTINKVLLVQKKTESFFTNENKSCCLDSRLPPEQEVVRSPVLVVSPPGCGKVPAAPLVST